MVFDLDTIKQATPKHLRCYINEDFLNKFNSISEDEKIAEEYRNNIIGYTDVLSSGKYKVTDYFNAVKFVTLRALGRNITEAYIGTFPNRYKKLKDEGVEDVSSYASMYNKNKLVLAILEQCMVPVHIINQDKHQKALHELFKLGTDNHVGPLTRVKALDAFLNYTKAPENKDINIQVGISNNEAMQDLLNTMRDFSASQRQNILEGKQSPKDIIEAKIIDSKVIEDE